MKSFFMHWNIMRIRAKYLIGYYYYNPLLPSGLRSILQNYSVPGLKRWIWWFRLANPIIIHIFLFLKKIKQVISNAVRRETFNAGRMLRKYIFITDPCI